MLRQLLFPRVAASRGAARSLQLARRSMSSLFDTNRKQKPRHKGVNYGVHGINPNHQEYKQKAPPIRMNVVEDTGEDVAPHERPWRRQAASVLDIPDAMERGLNAHTLVRLKEGTKGFQRANSLKAQRASKVRHAKSAKAGASGNPAAEAAPSADSAAASSAERGDGPRRGLSPAAAEEGDQPSVDEFAAHRLHGAYAGAHRMLWEARARLPDFSPKDTLEFGAGLAPTAWAAGAVWEAGADQRQHTAVEPNPELRAAGAELCTPGAGERATARGAGGSGKIAEGAPAITWVDKLPPHSVQYDIVSAPYCLEALPADSLRTAVASLWARVREGGLFAVALPATRSGFATLLLVREALLEVNPDAVAHEVSNLRVLAPCPHAFSCPMRPGGMLLPWLAKRGDKVPPVCHTEQKVFESSASAYLYRLNRNGPGRAQFLEKFSYLVVQKTNPAQSRLAAQPQQPLEGAGEEVEEGAAPEAASSAVAEIGGAGAGPDWSRVVRPPRLKSKHVHLDLCTADGEVVMHTLTKRKQIKTAYRSARKLRMGQVWDWGVQGHESARDAGRTVGDEDEEDEDEESFEEYYVDE